MFARIFAIAAVLSLAACAGSSPDPHAPRNALGFLVHGYGPCGDGQPSPCPGVELPGVADGIGGGGGA